MTSLPLTMGKMALCWIADGFSKSEEWEDGGSKSEDGKSDLTSQCRHPQDGMSDSFVTDCRRRFLLEDLLSIQEHPEWNRRERRMLIVRF